jgi:uncharacterized membrane protein (DUF106 family)
MLIMVFGGIILLIFLGYVVSEAIQQMNRAPKVAVKPFGKDRPGMVIILLLAIIGALLFIPVVGFISWLLS